MFLRKSRIEPLPVTMSAVRMGDRVLQIGVDDPAVVSSIAAKVGLSGNAAIAVIDDRDAARAHDAAANAGILIDVKVTPLAPLPFDNEAFDLVIVHSMRGLISSLDPNARIEAMREWHRVIRHGGRVMTIEPGAVSGIKGLIHQRRGDEAYEGRGGVVAALESAGFRPVRLLADREGHKFVEGMKL
jgi:SAM-dependent methyltransferase